MKKNLFKISLVVGIIILFTCSSFASTISGFSNQSNQMKIDDSSKLESQEEVIVSCRTYGIPGKSTKEIEMPYSKIEIIFNKINEIAHNPLSDEAEQLQEEIILMAKKYNLLPEDITIKDLQPRFVNSLNTKFPKKGVTPVTGNRGTASLCNFATTGEGSQFPIIILPRLIPILLTPIPRAFLHWSANEGFTTCGSLLTKTGFIASGMQRGTALGFWGIGFSVFLPPFMAYGFIGYALFATCTAEEIEPWPPNYAPEVSAVSPVDGAENVAISTSELSFQISDDNGDKMDYTVTTDPDMGSGSGSNKPGGTYSIPISGLEGTEEYRWYVEVTDGQKTVEASFSFETEQVAPIVSNPIPKDGSRHTPVDLSQLSFYISDPQGDLMDYTVETVPYIGSDSGYGVGEGTYNVDASDLDNDTEYIWYVNVTDGINWKHKIFNFKTRPSPGPWWDENWTYRKYLGIMNVSNDYQMIIKVWKENGHDIPEEANIDCEDKCKEDFSDIRFVTFNGIECNYWIEEINIENGDHYAIIWVKTPSSGDEQLYLYYGNSEALDVSSGNDTFILFDDFNDGSLDTSKWTVYDGVPTEANGYLELGADGVKMHSHMSFTQGVRYRASVYFNDARNEGLCERKADGNVNYEGDGAYFTTATEINKEINVEDDGENEHETKDITLDYMTWVIHEIDWDTNYIDMLENDMRLSSASDPLPYIAGTPDGIPNIPIYFRTLNTDSDPLLRVNWVFIGKYKETSPSFCAFGEEEIY